MKSLRRLMLGLLSVSLIAISPVGAALGHADPAAAADTGTCPYRSLPAPPVDASEAPAPGKTSPAPLPVPAHPVGGDKLRACGDIQPQGSPPLPLEATSAAWVIADLDTGEVLAARDPHGRHRPASTIKVLLAALAIQKLDLDTVVTATEEDAWAEGSSVGIGPGGQYSIHTLLRGLMMNSGNDAAHALAGQLGGVDATVVKMNLLAAQLGALDTRAATPSGLDGPGMATSAYDLALIFRDAMADPVFTDLVSHGPIEFPGYPMTEEEISYARAIASERPQAVNAGAPEPPAIEPVPTEHASFWVANDNALLANYPGAIGGKTGFTDDAGHTYIGAAERNGRRLVVTLLQGTRIPVSPWEQAASLLDYGFALPAGKSVGTLVAPGEVAADGAFTEGDGDLSLTGTAANLNAGGSVDAGSSAMRYAVIGISGALALALLLGAAKLRRRR
ncbi:D-alanyl-D-alanine carboxypeptidase family protein [Tomitella biformata]|uniref:D-alanyl-D-alanine carboxypeptidase family protein n=1 Tax=Tomitella biformata TaxID=630403 RepID=UPI00046709B5|nr:D-alanyl-D-alanine carboxypeptidase family protein [Tomitella biformata]